MHNIPLSLLQVVNYHSAIIAIVYVILYDCIVIYKSNRESIGVELIMWIYGWEKERIELGFY